MISVLIADDEPSVCQLVHHLIDWQGLEMEFAGFAPNGVQALDMIREKKPDIVISDIRMPGISGLDLVRMVREEHQEVSFILISGYREFEFARQAIQYGVEDYLLKPIRGEELNARLRKTASAIHQDRSRESGEKEKMQAEILQNDVRRSWLEQLLRREILGAESLNEINRRYHYRFVAGEFRLWQLELTCREDPERLPLLRTRLMQDFQSSMKEYFDEMETVTMENYGFALANRSVSSNMDGIARRAREWRLQWERAESGIRIMLAVSGPFMELSGLESAWKETANGIASGIWREDGRCVIGSGTPVEPVHWTEDMEAELRKAVSQQDAEELKRTIRRIVRDQEQISSENWLAMLEAEEKAYLTAAQIAGENVGEECPVGKEYRKLFRQCISRSEQAEVREAFCHRMMEWNMEHQSALLALPIKAIRQYMKDHYGEKITLEDMAELVHLNSGYISGLFRKETGMTFLEYLTELRMEGARELLQRPELNISQVAEQVGYNDVRYFSRTFSRFFGINPREYRKLHQ